MMWTPSHTALRSQCKKTSSNQNEHKQVGGQKDFGKTAHYVEIIQEIWHLLKGVTRYSEMDIGHAFHQIAVHPGSHHISTFRTHEGLHLFKVLFFRGSPDSELFHYKIKEALHGLPGCHSIHNNIFVCPEEHETNLALP